MRRGWLIAGITALWLLGSLGGIVDVRAADGGLASNPPRPDDWSALTAAERGAWLLHQRSYLPPDFDEDTLQDVWHRWPLADRRDMPQLPAAEQRARVLQYYGMTPRTDDPSQPLGYVQRSDGQYSMNCLACHAGQLGQQPWPGLGNNRTALQTLTEDVRVTKLLTFKPLSHLDNATLTLPLATTHGTTNAVAFGVILGALRRPDMTVDLSQPIPPFEHHDMDAPPFWNVKHKSHLYIDGFAPKTPRVIMQFVMLPENDRTRMESWESDFADILAWIESVEPPAYPADIDADLAAAGRLVFADHCAQCHGVPGESYPEVTIPLADVQTDPVRSRALTREHREWMHTGWLSRFGADEVRVDCDGYVAPPLTGIWASAPYFHNGSVPTLWHVLYPESRPTVWQRTSPDYDHVRGGLTVETDPQLPTRLPPRDQRRYFDTSQPGKSAAGHNYPAALTPRARESLLEYLKSI